MINYKDYKIIRLKDRALWYGFPIKNCKYNSDYGYSLIKDHIVKNVSVSTNQKYGDHYTIKFTLHPELLTNDAVVYIHPSCKVMKSYVKQKFKLSNDPFKADVAVIPYEYPSYTVELSKHLIFRSMDGRTLYAIPYHSNHYDGFKNDIMDDIIKAEPGTLMKNISSNKGFEIHEELAFLEYVGIQSMAFLPKRESFAIDILQGSLPMDKIVTESQLTPMISTESNQITPDVLANIHSMMKSTDHDTRALALKTLATLNYMKYPVSTLWSFTADIDRSVIYNTLSEASANVKFMAKSIDPYILTLKDHVRQPDCISEEDYQMLISFIEKFNDNPFECIRCMPFTAAEKDGKLKPKLKKE